MDITAQSVRADNEPLARRLLAALHDRIGPQRFNTWFKHGTHVSFDDNCVKVLVPNPFVSNWIETHYRQEIAEAARAQTGKCSAVVVTVDPSLSGSLRKHELDRQAEVVSKATQGRARRRRPVGPSPLRHKLEDFVVGQSNKLAYCAAAEMAKDAAAPFNPLFIHGPCGVGKTHLLQGICNRLTAPRRSGGLPSWRYVTAEQFTNEFITALRHKTTEQFRARYRDLDLLAIDDVHFLAAKKSTQEEFLHTFNAIESAGKRIALAADAPPRLVGDLSERLISRFAAGMVVKIDAPDQATRMEILRRGARRIKLRASRDVLEYIAMHIRGSVRELEGALIKLAALAALDGGRLSLDMTRQSLADHLARTDSAIALGDIEAVTAAYFGITPADIHSSRRTRAVSLARRVAMFLARRHTRMSFPEIGRFMGKNHSSVVLAVQKMQAHLTGGEKLTWPTPTGAKSAPAERIVDLLTEQIT